MIVIEFGQLNHKDDFKGGKVTYQILISVCLKSYPGASNTLAKMSPNTPADAICQLESIISAILSVPENKFKARNCRLEYRLQDKRSTYSKSFVSDLEQKL